MTTIHDLTATKSSLYSAISSRRERAFLPPPRITADKWADEFRVVPTETSNISGQWQTSQVEVARGPMRAISDPAVRRIVIMASAQIMKTSTLETSIGYHMHLDPCPMLLYSASKDTVDATITKKLDPMIVNTPELADLWGGAKALETKNEKFQKYQKLFPGGDLELLTINSTANLRNRAAKVVMVDEVDDCQQVADGDPVSLAEARTISFKGAEKLILVSTPTIKGQSKIEAEYLLSDQRKPYVCCPHCGEWDYMKWKQVKYKDDEGKARPELARYVCEHCNEAWSEADRIKMLTTEGAIQYRQTRPFRSGDELQYPEVERMWDDDGLAVCKHTGETPVPVTRSGYWGWIAYHPQWSMRDIVEDWLNRQGDQSKLQEFVNNRRAETWTEQGVEHIEIDPEQFAARVEPTWDLVPSAVKVLTSGWDVQPMGKSGNGRLEGEIVGHGDGGETWSLAYHIIPGDPTEGDVWATLDHILKQPFETEDGRKLYVQATCIDTGGDNQQGDGSIIDAVTSFAGARVKRRIWAIKGASEDGARKPAWSGTAPTMRNGARLHQVGTQAIKDWISDCISKSQPGPGYMHVPADRDASWFTQMTNERRKYKKGRDGRMRAFWRPKYDGVRTEALDCRVYAKAAFEGLKRAMPAIGRLVPTAAAAAIPTPAPTADGDQAGENIQNSPPEKLSKPRRRPKIVRKATRPGASIW